MNEKGVRLLLVLRVSYELPREPWASFWSTSLITSSITFDLSCILITGDKQPTIRFANVNERFPCCICFDKFLAFWSFLPRKNRTQKSINKCLFVGVCVKRNFAGFCGGNFLVDDSGQRTIAFTLPHTARVFCSCSEYIYFILAHRIGFGGASVGCWSETTQFPTVEKTLSVDSRGEFRRLSLSKSFFQFARKLRWFLLASFINSFYQLEKQEN